MELIVKINTDNAAFKDIEGDTDKHAVIYQLRQEFKKIEQNIIDGVNSHKIKDMNGNSVGTVTIKI